MANAKRASMREGPLAALFRKTDEDAEGDPAAPDTTPDPPAHPRETGLPHPALSASAAERAPEDTTPSVPTPRERLRHAFSSEIPEDVMD
ncbi:MAG TPA: cell division protein FtsZ, partial [Candidatus Dormibacteraeota bacterium]